MEKQVIANPKGFEEILGPVVNIDKTSLEALRAAAGFDPQDEEVKLARLKEGNLWILHREKKRGAVFVFFTGREVKEAGGRKVRATFQIPVGQLEALKAAAEDAGVSQSETIRRALAAYLEA